MLAAIYTQALFIVADVAYLRGAGVVLAFVRAFLGRQRFVAFRMGWVEGTPCRCSSRVRLRRRAEISSTGAISRIGRATAQVLAPGGATLALLWRNRGQGPCALGERKTIAVVVVAGSRSRDITRTRASQVSSVVRPARRAEPSGAVRTSARSAWRSGSVRRTSGGSPWRCGGRSRGRSRRTRSSGGGESASRGCRRHADTPDPDRERSGRLQRAGGWIHREAERLERLHAQ